MEKSTLGLPLEYDKLHEYYDVLCSGPDSDTKNKLIEKILRQHGVETVLDLTCGTGSQVLWLAQRGYKVTGSDFSPALLEIAKNKILKEGLAVQLLDGDMRTIQVGSFDAVITIFNAVGHLTKPDFEVAMKNIHSNLNAGGIYVFDILNLNAMTDAAVDKLAMDLQKTIGKTSVRDVQYSTINRENGRLTSYDRFTIQHGSDAPEIIEDSFTLQIYTAHELREMLARSGFETINQCSLDGSEFLEHETESILTVARKL